jgi:putative ABC transport system permease protein
MGTYIKIALRSLHREKLYAAINILGLALAIACAIVLSLYLQGELTYDRYNVNHAKIFRIVNEFNTNGSLSTYALTSPMLGPMLKEQYPDIVEDFVRLQPFNLQTQSGSTLRYEDQAYYWEGTYAADKNVLDVFTLDTIYGDPATAMSKPASIAISETVAQRYFGNENPIGKSLQMENGRPLDITLVFADQPANTHLKFEVLIARGPDQTIDNTTLRRATLWNISTYTYLVLPANFSPDAWSRINTEFYDKNMAELGRAPQINGTWRSWIEPLTQIHYHSVAGGYDQPVGNRFYLYGFAAVAIFIVLVACINYVNLATARATRRARAVGVQKILGAERGSLILQFMLEAFLFTLIATVVGIAIVEVTLTFAPVANLIGKPLRLDLVEQPEIGAAIFGFALVVGLLAGLYPAFYLSSWAPLSALVGRSRAGKGAIRFRQGLVFAQFAISIAVIAGTLLMAAQMRYISNLGLGFAKENRVVITLRGLTLIEQRAALINELLSQQGVLGASYGGSMMGQAMGSNVAQFENNEGTMQPMIVSHMGVGENFIETMGMSIAQGRAFSQRFLTDVGASFVVNEALVATLGWTEPIGKRMTLGTLSGRVIGVVRNFNFKSLHSPVEPFVMYRMPEDAYAAVPEAQRPFAREQLVLNIAGENIGRTLSSIQDVFKRMDPVHPFEFTFLDESLDKLYTSETQLMRLIGLFAGICIFIACLGLFGLAAFTTEQRTKEIGIRKVLGASTAQIILLLSRNVLLLVAGAAVVASLAAFLAIDQWLAGFAYRAPINPFVFVAATAAAALVAFATIALQSFRTARADPVDALRYE